MKIWTLAAAFAAGALLLCGPPAQAADNYTVKDSTGATKTICAEDASGIYATCHVSVNADGSTKVDPATSTLQTTANTKLDTVATDIGSPGETACATDTASCSNNQQNQRIAQRLTTIDGHVDGIEASLTSLDAKVGAGLATTTITRPSDTTAYAVNDTFADSTSAPTTGGFTLSSVCRASGTSGILDGVVVISTNDPTTLLQGEIWLFDSAGTAVNDNAAFALSDGDAVKLVGIVPFVLASSVAGSGTNSVYTVSGLQLPYTCSGTANLRYLVKVKNAYTPASAEQLTVRASYRYTN